MDIGRFKQLPISHQREQVERKGTPLGLRRSKRYTIYLFAVHSFYAELYFHKQEGIFGCLSVFEEIDKLAPYLKQIDISGLIGS